MRTDRIVRIGGASGAWGDSPMGLSQLLDTDVDYLMMDYLAEVTMSLLARARLRDRDAGYPPDFVSYLKPHLATVAERGIKIVSNAGGVNPQACKRALERLAAEVGIPLRVAVVEGDDLMPNIDALRRDGTTEWISGQPLPAVLLTANAYLGALPIRAALDAGADIVVTGRCVDSALALGILMHEFGWSDESFDLLSTGSLVGHLLECGPQVTGGVFTDWEDVPDWHNIGYPIAECRADGRFTITKPPGTGGLVTPATVAEQVLYEIGDPTAYLLPDVSADFSHVRLSREGPDRVAVSGATGGAPTDRYKVSATYQDGHRATAMISIVGLDAVRKAERTAEALLARAGMQFERRALSGFSAVHVEVVGAESAYGSESRARMSREVILRLSVEHSDLLALKLFAAEIGSVGLSFAQGTTGLIGGRPKAVAVVRLFTFLIDKSRVAAPRVQVGDALAFEVDLPPTRAARTNGPTASSAGTLNRTPPADECVTVPLLRVAHARSGDKGDSSNIAVYCRRPEYMDHLREVLTAEAIGAHFAGLTEGSVVRYEAPGLAAFNFLLDRALGGGGMASMRLDAQGKAYGQRALEMLIPVPRSWLT